MDLALQITALVLGLCVLVWSANLFVDGASAVARLLGVPALLIGIVVIGFGTSAPELAVSAFAAADGNPSIALGNAFGSNTCNIALILGLCAALRPIPIRRGAVLRETGFLVLATAIAAAFLVTDSISRAEAFWMLAIFFVLLAVTSVLGIRDRAAAPAAAGAGRPLSPWAAALRLAAGLALLVGSSKALVWGASGIARAAGVSDLLIGLTVVAIGTSLPELASSVAATLRGEDDLAVGNIIGSNMFNTLAVVGLAGAISPFDAIPRAVLHRDLPAAGLFTVLLLAFAAAQPRRACTPAIRRWEGALLLAGYIAYTFWILRAEGGA